jgi:hypothetical protein
MTTKDKMVDRVRKLLALANSSNEHEAAAAAAQAAALMVQFEIEAAMLDTDCEPVTELPENEILDKSARNRVPWKVTIAGGIANSVGGRVYTSGGTVHVVAQPGKLATISYLYAYLVSEVNRLADLAYGREVSECDASLVSRPSARSWKNAFRLGAAGVIRSRLATQRAFTKQEAKNKALAEGGGNRGCTALATTTRALEIMAKAEKDVDAFIRKNVGPLGRAAAASHSSNSGYGAGRQAGGSMGLGGSARGMLGK